jgi:hypothetical protein
MTILWWIRKIAATTLASSLMLLPSRGAETPTQVYVYVQEETPARSWFPVWFDGVLVAKIKRGRFFVINAAPGRHMLSEERGVPVFIEARPGKKIFIRLEWRNGELPGPAIPVWETISQRGAHDDMLSLTYIDADKAISKSVPKTEPRESPHLMRRGDTNDD